MAKLKKGDTIGGKTKKYSEAGKGDKNRVSNISKYAENWEKIFGNKKSKKWNSLQMEKVIWFTGQPGAGKTTLAKEMVRRFNNDKVINIDGDDLREVLDNKDYSERGRRKNIQFAIDMAKIMESKGYLVIVSMVSPYRDLRYGNVFWIRSDMPTDKEKYWVDNYEPPLKDHYMIDTTNQSVEESVNEILNVCR